MRSLIAPARKGFQRRYKNMLLKMWYLVLVLTLAMVISNASSSESILFINGIGVTANDQQNIQKFVNNLDPNKYDAHYAPTYLSNDINPIARNAEGAREVVAATPAIVFGEDNGEITIESFDYRSTGPSMLNGLENDLLKGSTSYDTIIAHSGGTRTAVTALLNEGKLGGIKADTLILISPIMGPETLSVYKKELEYLLQENIVKNIIVYQSPQDKLPFTDALYNYQAKFDPNNPGIEHSSDTTFTVKNINLGGLYVPYLTSTCAHVEMWYKVLEDTVGSSPNRTGPCYLIDNTANAVSTGFKNLMSPLLPQPVYAEYSRYNPPAVTHPGVIPVVRTPAPSYPPGGNGSPWGF